MKKRTLFTLLLIAMIAVLLASCGGGDEEPAAEQLPAPTEVPATATPVPPTDTPVPPTDTPVPPTATPVPPTPEPEASTYEDVRVAAEAYVTSGASPVIAASALFENLNDGDEENDPFIISVRAPDAYAAGHIPGAVNIPWKTIVKPESLEMIPTDQPIVVYCYTGHTGQIATTALNMLGYEAVNMKWGMTGWTSDPDVLMTTPYDPATGADYAVETEPNEATETYDPPVQAAEDVRAAIDAWINGEDVAVVVPSAGVFENLNDGDEDNDPVIISVRAPDAYELGHIPGAINIPWKSITDPENLAKIPTDQPVLVYCYTGHTGQLATTILGSLGYDVSNMKWGMMAWTLDDEVLATGRFDPAAVPDYPTEAGAMAASGDTYEDVRLAAEAYVTSDKAPVIAASAVFENLNDGDEDNDPFIVSVRAPDAYAAGHIPGAINIPWKTIVKPESLAMLPTDEPILVYCYTGHTGQIATTALNMLGYDAVNMKWGMTGWTSDPDVLMTTPYDPATGADYAVETEPNEATETYDPPVQAAEDVRAAIDAWINGEDVAVVVPSAGVFENLNDGDEDNDPVIISVRAPDAYELGHIPGAINIPWKSITDPANLAKIPTDQPVLVYCYTGHTGQLATTVLGSLGYDVSNMKWGMMAWTLDDEVLATGRFDPAAVPDYPTEAGAMEMSAASAGDTYEEVRVAAEAYLSSGRAPTIAAGALFENLNDGDEENDPFIISVRAPDAYAAGHIDGAVNIPWKTIVKPESLEQIPTDQPIVVYCYTGHTGQLATTALNLLGYEATNLKYGMMGWNNDPDILMTAEYDPATGADYRVEVEANEATETYDQPVQAADDVRSAIDAWINGEDVTPIVPSSAVFENLNDGDEDNDPFLISVRGPDNYEVGHVPGAINIPWKTIADPANLALIPDDEPVAAYCYTGHTGQVAATILGSLGYDVSNMKFGMMGWSLDDEVLGLERFDPASVPDYPTVSGS